jgi:hypothetical protein
MQDNDAIASGSATSDPIRRLDELRPWLDDGSNDMPRRDPRHLDASGTEEMLGRAWKDGRSERVGIGEDSHTICVSCISRPYVCERKAQIG